MPSNGMRVVCLTKRYPHHTASGGYDRLASAIGAEVFSRQLVSSLFGRAVGRAWRSITSASDYLVDYQFGDWLAEYRLLASTLRSPPDVVHVLYADGQLNELLRWRRYLRSGLVASFHSANIYRAVQRFERLQTFAPKLIDAAIVVSNSQVEVFEKWFGRGKVVYIPHGIDTERFSPCDRQVGRERLSLLTVGDHMRDWHVLHTVIDEVNRRGLPVDFQIVTFERNFAYLTGCTHTTLYVNISEQALIDLYRNSDAAFLPFNDATANNSVLEALACGTPVISTSVGGVPDYVNEKSGWLFAKGDVSSILGLIEAMSRNRAIARSRRKEARVQALRFSWPIVATRLLGVYAAIKNGRPPLEAAGGHTDTNLLQPAEYLIQSHHRSPQSERVGADR